MVEPFPETSLELSVMPVLKLQPGDLSEEDCTDCYLHFWKNKRELQRNCSQNPNCEAQMACGHVHKLGCFTDFLSEEIRLSPTIGFPAWFIFVFWEDWLWHHWNGCIADISHAPLKVQVWPFLMQKLKECNLFLEKVIQALLSITVKNNWS